MGGIELEKVGVEATIIVKNRSTGEIVQQYNFDMTETDIIEMVDEVERIYTKKKFSLAVVSEVH
jgi:hypothetical protein